MRRVNLFWRLNENIRVPEVRLIGADGKQIGVVKIEEALKQAKEAGLTLVEIAPLAKPPVTKIVDFGKFRYEEEKKARKVHAKAKGGELKEIRFSPFIGEADYQTRLKRVREFLGEKNKVKVVVVFMGRQMGSKPVGFKLLERIFKELEGAIAIDMPPKFLGRHLVTIVSPLTKHAKNEDQKVVS